MNSFRKYLYAALLAFTTLNIAPSTVFAQETAHGRFTLPHDVRWENAVVPAGDYQFSIESDPIEVLRLDKISGPRAGFMFLIHDEEPAKPDDISRLLLEKTRTGSYVTAMQLPEFGMTLNFTLPASATEKQMAKATTTRAESAQP